MIQVEAQVKGFKERISQESSTQKEGRSDVHLGGKDISCRGTEAVRKEGRPFPYSERASTLRGLFSGSCKSALELQ